MGDADTSAESGAETGVSADGAERYYAVDKLGALAAMVCGALSAIAVLTAALPAATAAWLIVPAGLYAAGCVAGFCAAVMANARRLGSTRAPAPIWTALLLLIPPLAVVTPLTTLSLARRIADPAERTDADAPAGAAPQIVAGVAIGAVFLCLLVGVWGVVLSLAAVVAAVALAEAASDIAAAQGAAIRRRTGAPFGAPTDRADGAGDFLSAAIIGVVALSLLGPTGGGAELAYAAFMFVGVSAAAARFVYRVGRAAEARGATLTLTPALSAALMMAPGVNVVATPFVMSQAFRAALDPQGWPRRAAWPIWVVWGASVAIWSLKALTSLAPNPTFVASFAVGFVIFVIEAAIGYWAVRLVRRMTSAQSAQARAGSVPLNGAQRAAASRPQAVSG